MSRKLLVIITVVLLMATACSTTAASPSAPKPTPVPTATQTPQEEAPCIGEDIDQYMEKISTILDHLDALMDGLSKHPAGTPEHAQDLEDYGRLIEEVGSIEAPFPYVEYHQIWVSELTLSKEMFDQVSQGDFSDLQLKMDRLTKIEIQMDEEARRISAFCGFAAH